MSKIFFDANILLDILIPNRPGHKKAIKVYEIVCDRYDVLATSENILTTIEYIASKNGTDCSVLSKFFAGLEENFEFCNFTDILGSSLEIYRDACENGRKIDFEDLLQLESAIRHGCDVFLTEDKGIGNHYGSIEVLSLNDF